MEANQVSRHTEHVYTPLHEGNIRFVQLLPGSLNDDVHLEFIQAALPKEPAYIDPERASHRMSRRQLQKTCPPGWIVCESPEGRYVFSSSEGVTYTHPDPAIPLRMYAPLNETFCVEPLYEALSYTWGSEEKPTTVYVSQRTERDDECPMKALRISRNLGLALKDIRHATQPRKMWIDALCINQDDLEERNAQITHMSRIFSLARRVIAWLGPSTEDSKVAVAALQFLGEQVEVSKSHPRRLPRPGAVRADLVNRHIELPLTPKQWKALVSFFERPWFRRLWVTQEIILANSKATLQCGSDEIIELYFFRRALSCFMRRKGSPFSANSLTSMALCTFASGRGSRGVFDIFNRQWIQSCVNPRDRVYASLSIISEQIAHGIVPSYGAPVVDIYRDAFLHFCKMTQRLSFLIHCQWQRNSRGNEYPSWVPIWGSDLPCLALTWDYHASGISKASFEYDAGKRTLSVLGVRHSRIRKVFGPFSNTGPLQILKAISSAVLESAEYPTGESTTDSFTRALCLDLFEERIPGQGFPAIATVADMFKLFLKSLDENHPDESRFVELLNEIQSLFHLGAAFLQTDSGYCGFGPPDMEDSDLVCVFLGCMTPIILRPTFPGAEEYHLIGYAYIQGLMDSEALLGPLPRGWKVQVQYTDTLTTPHYFNEETGQMQVDDPRLPHLSPEWTPLEQEANPDDFPHAEYLENTTTGKVVNSDPRLLPENLRAIGVPLQFFDLV